MRTTVEVDDRKLVEGVARGDGDALRQLYERHAPWLSTRLRKQCADQSLVEEVVQDTFVAVWRYAARYEGRGAVGAWLWGIARRRLVDGLRRLPRASLPLADTWPEPRAEERLLAGLDAMDVLAVIRRLPTRERVVAQATMLDGLTVRETAVSLGLPEGTVKTRLMRARAGLRDLVSSPTGRWAA